MKRHAIALGVVLASLRRGGFRLGAVYELRIRFVRHPAASITIAVARRNDLRGP